MMRFQVSRDDVSFTFNFIFSIPISSPCPAQNVYSYRLWQSTSDSMSINGSSFESQLECPHHGSLGDAFVCTVGDEHVETVKKSIAYALEVLMFFWKGTESWHPLNRRVSNTWWSFQGGKSFPTRTTTTPARLQPGHT
jgi:hypothetical protein